VSVVRRPLPFHSITRDNLIVVTEPLKSVIESPMVYSMLVDAIRADTRYRWAGTGHTLPPPRAVLGLPPLHHLGDVILLEIDLIRLIRYDLGRGE